MYTYKWRERLQFEVSYFPKSTFTLAMFALLVMMSVTHLTLKQESLDYTTMFEDQTGYPR